MKFIKLIDTFKVKDVIHIWIDDEAPYELIIEIKDLFYKTTGTVYKMEERDYKREK